MGLNAAKSTNAGQRGIETRSWRRWSAAGIHPWADSDFFRDGIVYIGPTLTTISSAVTATTRGLRYHNRNTNSKQPGKEARREAPCLLPRVRWDRIAVECGCLEATRLNGSRGSNPLHRQVGNEVIGSSATRARQPFFGEISSRFGLT